MIWIVRTWQIYWDVLTKAARSKSRITIRSASKELNFWDPVVDRCRKRLTRWKANYLSFGGRTTLFIWNYHLEVEFFHYSNRLSFSLPLIGSFISEEILENLKSRICGAFSPFPTVPARSDSRIWTISPSRSSLFPPPFPLSHPNHPPRLSP